MKRFHHVTFTVFLRPQESLDFLEQLFPIAPKTFLEEQFTYDPNHERTKIYSLKQAKLVLQEAAGFEEGITVVKCTFDKISHTNELFNTVYSSLSTKDQDVLKTTAEERTDEHGRFVLRLDKSAFEQGTYSLTEGGNCIHCAFLIAVYPKNEKTIKEGLRRLFS